MYRMPRRRVDFMAEVYVQLLKGYAFVVVSFLLLQRTYWV